MTIEKDWRALIGNALWAWILIWIPTAVIAVQIATTSHRFDSSTLSWKRGLITKKTTNVDLRRVRSISAEDSIFTGGRLLITETDGTQLKIPYLKHPEEVARKLRELTEKNARDQGGGPNWVVN